MLGGITWEEDICFLIRTVVVVATSTYDINLLLVSLSNHPW
jgi:hypothetical protein